jgi:hypothetical protein
VENAVEGDATLTRAIIVPDGILASICVVASFIAASKSMPTAVVVLADEEGALPHPKSIKINNPMNDANKIFLLLFKCLQFFIQ